MLPTLSNPNQMKKNALETMQPMVPEKKKLTPYEEF